MNLSRESLWLVVGFAGQLAFTGRFVLQWLYSEYKKRSVIPTSFWYLSIVGSALLLMYAIYRQDPVFIAGQAFGFIVYLRNLQLIVAGETHDKVPGHGRRLSKSLIDDHALHPIDHAGNAVRRIANERTDPTSGAFGAETRHHPCQAFGPVAGPERLPAQRDALNENFLFWRWAHASGSGVLVADCDGARRHNFAKPARIVPSGTCKIVRASFRVHIAASSSGRPRFARGAALEFPLIAWCSDAPHSARAPRRNSHHEHS